MDSTTYTSGGSLARTVFVFAAREQPLQTFALYEPLVLIFIYSSLRPVCVCWLAQHAQVVGEKRSNAKPEAGKK